MFVIEFMDEVAESVEYVCSLIYQEFVKPLAVALIKLLIIFSYPIWVVPHKVFRNIGKNKKSAEAYASKGEKRC